MPPGLKGLKIDISEDVYTTMEPLSLDIFVSWSETL